MVAMLVFGLRSAAVLGGCGREGLEQVRSRLSYLSAAQDSLRGEESTTHRSHKHASPLAFASAIQSQCIDRLHRDYKVGDSSGSRICCDTMFTTSSNNRTNDQTCCGVLALNSEDPKTIFPSQLLAFGLVYILHGPRASYLEVAAFSTRQSHGLFLAFMDASDIRLTATFKLHTLPLAPPPRSPVRRILSPAHWQEIVLATAWRLSRSHEGSIEWSSHKVEWRRLRPW